MEAILSRKFESWEKQRIALITYLNNCPTEKLNLNPAPEQWSPLQVIQHLILAEEISLKSVKAKLVMGNFEAAKFFSRWRELALKIALRSPLKFRAPAAVSKIPAVLDLNELLATWEKVRADWKELLETLTPDLLGNYLYKHPVAGKLKLTAGLDFMYDHVRRHEQQIRRTIKQA